MFWFIPRIAYAAETPELILKINEAIINPVIKILFAIALLVFLWGIVEMLTNKDEAEKLITGRKHMFWGVVGLFIMVSVFGIINVIIEFIGQIGQ